MNTDIHEANFYMLHYKINYCINSVYSEPALRLAFCLLLALFVVALIKDKQAQAAAQRHS
jgi:hypothetical protein